MAYRPSPRTHLPTSPRRIHAHAYRCTQSSTEDTSPPFHPFGTREWCQACNHHIPAPSRLRPLSGDNAHTRPLRTLRKPPGPNTVGPRMQGNASYLFMPHHPDQEKPGCIHRGHQKSSAPALGGFRVKRGGNFISILPPEKRNAILRRWCR
jgi:hypothetical protein